MRLAPVRGLVRSAAFPYAFQALLLVVFLALAASTWGAFPPQGIEPKDFAKSHLAQLVIWALWWPAMIWVAVLLGRAWCAVCPLELISNLSERLGRYLGIRQATMGRLLRSGALILLFYAMAQAAVVVLQLHRIPAYTSMFLLAMLAMAVLTGLVFRDRAFCRGFCPVGLLLNAYGRGAMLAVRACSSSQCGRCRDKACSRNDRRELADARSCPSLIQPSRLDQSSDCLLCGQCVKSCSSNNIGLFLRRPFSAADRRDPIASWPLTLFVMLVSGFVAYELSSEWKRAEALFLWVPQFLAAKAALGDYVRVWQAAWTLFAVPLATWTVLGLLVRVLGGAGSVAEAWRRLALPMAVLMAAGQMAKGVAKFVSWAGYLPYDLQRPMGTETALAIAAKTLAKPVPLVSIQVVSVIGLVVMAAMLWLALRESRLADASTHRGRAPVIAGVGLAALAVIYGWGFLA